MIELLRRAASGPGSVPRALVPLLLSFGAIALGQAGLEQFAVQPGYALEIDVGGFALPTAIAFVPEPGDAPADPLYFVAELQGAIKVVTSDRTVHAFAQVPAARGQTTPLLGTSQSGLAGLCLDADNGYVFVTYTEADQGGVLRNRIARFASTPGTFDLAASETRSLDAMLAPFQAAPAHQIGTCVVHDERLYVGVGDGGNFAEAVHTDALLGKVLCLDENGAPCPDNPFLEGAVPAADGTFPPEAYVYGYGFRNPFGLVWVDGQLFAAENGIDLDRFLPVRKGEDHLWRGTDQSLTVRAELVFVPTISPVQTTYLPSDAAFVDATWRDRFVSAVFGGKGTSTGVVGYGGATDRAPDVPRYLLEYVGEPGTQHFSAVALGPDGVYTVGMLPGEDGTSSVLRLRYDPSAAHATMVTPRASLETMQGLGVLATQGCVSCHAVEGKGGGIGPSLDSFGVNWRLTQRLNAPEYTEQVARVDALDEEPFASWRAARQEVLQAHGTERTWTWLKYYLQEPRFDRPENQMPNLGLDQAEAEELRAQLFRVLRIPVPGARGSGLVERGLAFVRSNARAVGAGAIVGAGAMLVLAALVALLARRRTKGRARTAD